jgi:Fe2+ or Zn2+ uptake regulation protein
MIPKKKLPGAPDTLRARGLRLTAPRRLILDVVRASDLHPSAATVYRQVRRRLPGVSLATVYRNLRMLAAHGLLAERSEIAGMRFDGNTERHDHFTCVTCGRIYDVPPLAAAGVRRALGASTGFEVLEHRIEFSGRCVRCRGRTSRPPRTKEETWRAKSSKASRAFRDREPRLGQCPEPTAIEELGPQR